MPRSGHIAVTLPCNNCAAIAADMFTMLQDKYLADHWELQYSGSCSLTVDVCAGMQCLRLLHGLTAVRCINSELLVGKRWPKVNSNAAAIIMDLQATAMVGLRVCLLYVSQYLMWARLTLSKLHDERSWQRVW